MNKFHNFTQKDLECPCCQICYMDTRMLDKLNQLRTQCGFSLNIKSAFRCVDYNLSLEGSEESMHVQGKAVNLKIGHLSSIKKSRFFKALKAIKFQVVEEIDDYIHLEIFD